jgi:hypothetical protein
MTFDEYVLGAILGVLLMLSWMVWDLRDMLKRKP